MIENKILNILIHQQKYEIMTKINPLWFNDKNNQEIYKCCVHCFYKLRSLNENKIKEYINDNGYKDIQKNIMFTKLDSIKDEYSLYSKDLINDFEGYYKNNKFTSLMNVMVDKKNTVDIKEKELTKTYREIISNKQEFELYELDKTINEYIKNVIDGKQDEFRERSIKFRSAMFERLFSGYLRPWLVVIASRPGMHKTTLTLNIINELLYLNKKGLFFSFEDSIETLRNKIICIKKDWSFSKVSDAKYTDKEKQELESLIQQNNNKLWITDKRYTLTKFREIIDRQFAIRKYDFIVIDYLQLFYREKGFKEHEYLDLLTQEMISITHDYQVPILLLSQVNDRDDNNDNVDLHLGNLKGSSGIEQNARQVIILNGDRKESVRTVKMVKNTGGGLFHFDIDFNSSGLIGGFNV